MLIRKFLPILLVAVSMAFSLNVLSQTGTIKGVVKEKVSSETLPGANVVIEGTLIGISTDLDGAFTLANLKPGTYTLKVSFISYNDKVIPNVVVKANQDTQLVVELEDAALTITSVVVEAKMRRDRENVLLLERRKSNVISQSIGAQELSRKGVSNAQGAVSKISGISKQEGVKNVFVRGLGDRYNTTTLNGFALPSEDPEYKNISLGFFTNDMIQAVTVSKVFSASMSGDVGGALIDIRSKELVNDMELEIGLSSGTCSNNINRVFLQPDGVNGLGYANASYGPYENENDYSFNTTLDPIQYNAPYNRSVSVAWGKKFRSKHRFYIVGTVGNDFEFQKGISRDITATDSKNPFSDMTYERFMRNSSHLLMGNLELDYSESKVSFNSLYVHTAMAYASDSYGKHTETFQIAEDFNSEGLERRLQVNDNTILVNQLLWARDISQRVKMNVGASVNHVIGKEPDRRLFRFPSVGNGMVQLAVAESRNQRFNSEISETAIIPKVNIQFKLSDDTENSSLLEVGYNSRVSYKGFSAPFYNHIWSPLTSAPTFDRHNVMLNPYFNQQNLSDNLFRLEHFNDTYKVLRSMHGVYVDLVYQLSSRLTVNSGLRADYVFTKIDYEVNRGASMGSDTINGIFLSPSLNIKYELNEKNHLRMGASRTFTLPQDKEISPFIYLGFDGNDNGNPDLKISTNYNLDLKWDYFISNSEIFSLSGFYKYILNPIARVDQGNSAGLKTFDNVTDHAIAAGVEVELRKRLLSIKNKHNFNAGVNASYIYSRLNLNPVWFVQNTTSMLEGAAPYIVNADLTYSYTSSKFAVTSAIVLNYLSDKVHTIGTRGYNNLIEESVTTLDFINSFKIRTNITVNVKARNLLDPDFKLTRKGAGSDTSGVVIRSFKKGMIFDLGFTYSF